MVVTRILACLALCTSITEADTGVPAGKITGLADSSIEELMQIEVTSVNKRQQKLSRSAAAIYVITQEDIRRSGMTTIPEVLRLVPGLHVARINESIWAIGIRGFNDEFSNKLLVLVDGRSIYSELFSGVYWDTQDVMLENVERIEVIRGPGAAVWGANSVNGVINVITKSAAETQGEYLAAGTGSSDRVVGSLRHGGKIGKRAHYRTHFRHGDRKPFPTPSGPGNFRNWRSWNSGFRLDWDHSEKDSLTVIGDMYRATSCQTTIYPNPANLQPLPEPTSTSNSSILGRWSRRLSDTFGTMLQVTYDDFTRRDLQLPTTAGILAVDFQNEFALSDRHNLIWGAGYRTTQFETTPRAVQFASDRIRVNLFSSFVQDEYSLVRNKLFVIAGLKVEHNSFTQFEAQPTVRAVWEPNAKSSTWVSFSRAVRTPSLVENSVRVAVPVPPPVGFGVPLPPLTLIIRGNENFLPETVLAYEAGQRTQLHRRAVLDLAFFFNSYNRLQGISQSLPRPSLEGEIPGLSIDGRYGNTHRANSYGGEVTGTWSAADRWKLTASYSRLQTYRDPLPGFEGAHATNGAGRHPLNQYQARSYFDLSRNIQIDAAIFFTGRLKSDEVRRNFRADFRLGWAPRDYLEISMVGQRLFGPRVTEFKSDRFAETYWQERAIFGKVTWRF